MSDFEHFLFIRWSHIKTYEKIHAYKNKIKSVKQQYNIIITPIIIRNICTYILINYKFQYFPYILLNTLNTIYEFELYL